MNPVPKVLTIAGSDSGAGAGIQADLKTFAALRVYGTSVITAVTAQNTVKVAKVHPVDFHIVGAQIDAVLNDIGADAVKTGMLATAEIIEVVAAKLRSYKCRNIVVDPVLAATSGDSLVRGNAVKSLRSVLLPLADVITPNIPEAEVLTGLTLDSSKKIREAAERIRQAGAKTVVVKGGHRRGPAVDLFYDGHRFHEFRGPRIRTRHTHGTGCTFSAAIAAHLALGKNTDDAVQAAKEFITQALRGAFPVGAGHGPVHHFFEFWNVK